jgi:hypothetical protein
MATVYYAAFDEDGQTPIGLFRVIEDESAQTLELERLSSDGSWTPDPSVIEELQEPGVTLIDPAEAPQIEQAILAGAEPDEGELSSEDIADAAAAATPPGADG